MIEIRAYANVDHAHVVWRRKPLKPIDGCLGFALYRKPKGEKPQVVSTFVGPETEDKVPAGTSKPSTTWPIQKYMWSDYLAKPGDIVQYQVVAMCGSDFDHLQPGESSDWSKEV